MLVLLSSVLRNLTCWAVCGKDLVDMNTGVVLAEAGDEITEDILVLLLRQ